MMLIIMSQKSNKVLVTLTLAATLAGASIISSPAQETKPATPKPEARPAAREGERERAPQPGGFMRMNPVLAALDTNGDGSISTEEINNAPAALKQLDKNGDGKITEDEVRPSLPRGERERERERGPAGGANVAELVKRMLEFDKNGDGKLSKEELPERMQSMVERGEADKDGSLSQEELKKLVESQNQNAGAGAARRPEGGERRPERRER
jgi:Ca2+-binding EF-hand superfamily protein